MEILATGRARMTNSSEKTLKTSPGDMEIAIFHDRKGEFEARLVKKNQAMLSLEIFFAGRLPD